MRINKAKVERTHRGFQIVRFEDRDGETCSLQQSSLANYEPPGSSAVWLGLGADRMHLDVEDVEALIPLLSTWLSDGRFDPPIKRASRWRRMFGRK